MHAVYMYYTVTGGYGWSLVIVAILGSSSSCDSFVLNLVHLLVQLILVARGGCAQQDFGDLQRIAGD